MRRTRVEAPASAGKAFDGVFDDHITRGYEVVNRSERFSLRCERPWGTSGGHVLWVLRILWFVRGFLANWLGASVAHRTGGQGVLERVDG